MKTKSILKRGMKAKKAQASKAPKNKKPPIKIVSISKIEAKKHPSKAPKRNHLPSLFFECGQPIKDRFMKIMKRKHMKTKMELLIYMISKAESHKI